MKKVKCQKLDIEAKGLVKLGNKEIGIDYLLDGEEALIDKDQVVEIISPSEARIKPQCKYYYECGGCHLQHMNYQRQLRYKTDKVIELFKNNIKEKVKVIDCVASKDIFNYRNKAQATFKMSKTKKVTAGFYQENSHNIISYDKCLVQNEISNNIISSVKEILNELKLSAYDEDSKKGLIRHIMVRNSSDLKQIMVVIITSKLEFPARKQFVSLLRKRHPEITTIIQNINPRQTSIVLGDQEKILFGPGFIQDKLCGLTFNLSSKSFYQINHDQTEKLYDKVMELAKIKSSDVVLDAYCGIGTMSLLAAKKAKYVYGVEVVKDAVNNAINNAKLNKINNAYFVCEDATTFMPKFVKEKIDVDVAIIDPPRNGCSIDFLKSLNYLKPKKIIYVSCEPKTQVRDLKTLLNNYKIEKVIPFDMFCQTNHVECVVMMSRKNK